MGAAAKRRDKRKAAKAHTTVRTYLPEPDRTGRAAKPTGWFADNRARLFFPQNDRHSRPQALAMCTG